MQIPENYAILTKADSSAAQTEKAVLYAEKYIFFSNFSEKQAAFLCELAEKNKLFITAGSDYHGENKAVRLGTLCTDVCPSPLPYLKDFIRYIFCR